MLFLSNLLHRLVEETLPILFEDFNRLYREQIRRIVVYNIDSTNGGISEMGKLLPSVSWLLCLFNVNRTAAEQSEILDTFKKLKPSFSSVIFDKTYFIVFVS